MTYEEALKEIKTQADKRNRGIDYRLSDSAITRIQEALEKQIPKKPIEDLYPWAICPACNANVFLKHVQTHIEDEENTYCEHCGQALDWSDT